MSNNSQYDEDHASEAERVYYTDLLLLHPEPEQLNDLEGAGNYEPQVKPF